MGKLFSVPAAASAAIRDGLDDVLAALGKDCRLAFPPLLAPCPNCVFDSAAQASSGRYLAGGPEPFTNGSCPVCRERGVLSVPQEGALKAIVYRSAADFPLARPANAHIPAGHVVVKFAAADLPAVLRAQRLTVQPGAPGVSWACEPAGEPVDAHNLAPGRYLFMTWKRVP